MNTQIVYVLTSSEEDLYLEELWASVYSLKFHNTDTRVLVLTNSATAKRIKSHSELLALINKVIIVKTQTDYSTKEQSRFIKTNIRNIISGDFLFIDTDTIICDSIAEIDNLPIKNIGMVPELHGPFKNHLTYEFTCKDTKRIFNVDVSDSPYWFNSGCMFVRDNDFTHKFFTEWQKNWIYSAFQKHNSSDQRALLKTDHDHGYVIECIPDIYNSQIAMSLRWFYKAKIIHFWHFRKYFTPNMDFSPFLSHQIYRDIRKEGTITSEISQTILNCKSAFRNDSMVIGKDDINFVMSTFNTILWKQYIMGGPYKWMVDKLIHMTSLYQRASKKLKSKTKH